MTVTDIGLAYWSYYILRMGRMQKPLSIIFLKQFPEWIKIDTPVQSLSSEEDTLEEMADHQIKLPA